MSRPNPGLYGLWQSRSKIENEKGQANAFNNLFVIAQEEQNYDSAFWYLDGALQVYQQIGDSSGIARSYANQAFLFDELQENDSAIEYNFKALEIQEALGNGYQQGFSYNQIGYLYSEKDQYTEALEYYQQALEIWEEIGDIRELANTHNHIGSTLVLLEKYPEALPHLEQGVEFARQTEDPFMIGSNLVSLAEWYRGQDKNDRLAREMYEEAVVNLKEADSWNLAAAYNGLGLLAMKQGKLEEAKQWFESELETAEEFEDLKNQSVALFNLVDIYEKEGKSNQALEYLRLYQEVRDSLVNEEKLETINNLSIRYESEKKEKENLILQNDLTKSQLATAEQKALRNQILGIAAIVLLLGLGGFLWYRYRQRIRIKEQEMALEQERARKEQERKEAEKLRELDAMKTRFFTNISHEFRTPLTLILGQNEQMQTATQDPGMQNRMEMVSRNGHRLLDLVNQVLDVAKIEAGGMDLDMTRQDAIPFLKHMLYSFESMAQEKEVELVFDSNLTELETAFDNKKIERVIFNLLSNAMKFTPAGGSVRMNVQREDEFLRIAIADSGVGIKASQLPYIFDRFYQADSSDNQAQPGTGIGLSLVKELVELHQGSIEVESEVGKGTSFKISLPIPENRSAFPLAIPESSLSPRSPAQQDHCPGVRSHP